LPTGFVGNLQAQLQGLAKKLLDVGGSGSGKITSSEYENVAREDLAANLHDVRTCRLKMFDSLKAAAFGQNRLPTPTPSWNQTDHVSGTYSGSLYLLYFTNGGSRTVPVAITLTIQGDSSGTGFSGNMTIGPDNYIVHGEARGSSIAFEAIDNNSQTRVSFSGNQFDRRISGNFKMDGPGWDREVSFERSQGITGIVGSSFNLSR
jgi:hypothetical protein